jgi:hypothetical protein
MDPIPEANESFEHFPLADAIDHEILMHRDAHFGGLFSVMLDYYAQEKKGVQPEFSMERIEKLDALEKQLKQNLAALFLTAPEMQKVADVREAYRVLKSIYELENAKTKHPRLIADLILAEDEEAEEEVKAIVEEKGAIVPALIDLLRNEQFHDSLFPGYGSAPSLAAKCLGLIGDKRAIISLFEAIGEGDFFADDLLLEALREIGRPAKEFLLRVVAGHPLNEDNEKAAIALLAFKEDEEVAETCFELFKQPDFQKDPCLSTYLILACEGLKNPEKQAEFKQMAHSAAISDEQRRDFQAVIHAWK